MTVSPYGFVYLIRNSVSGRVYVGQTTRSIEERWLQHVRDSRRGNCRLLHASIRKHGMGAFTVIQIAQADCQSTLNTEERRLVAEYKSDRREFGYNVRSGGDGGGPLSEETKSKLRAYMLGRPAHNKGKKMPAHQHAQMMERFKTNGHPCLGRPCSEETKAKIGAANKISKLGTKRTEESRKKQAQSLRAHFASNPDALKDRDSKRRGVPRSAAVAANIRSGWATPERVARRMSVIAMRQAGAKWSEIAAQFGVCRASVQEMYARHA